MAPTKRKTPTLKPNPSTKYTPANSDAEPKVVQTPATDSRRYPARKTRNPNAIYTPRTIKTMLPIASPANLKRMETLGEDGEDLVGPLKKLDLGGDKSSDDELEQNLRRKKEVVTVPKTPPKSDSKSKVTTTEKTSDREEEAINRKREPSIIHDVIVGSSPLLRVNQATVEDEEEEEELYSAPLETKAIDVDASTNLTQKIKREADDDASWEDADNETDTDANARTNLTDDQLRLGERVLEFTHGKVWATGLIWDVTAEDEQQVQNVINDLTQKNESATVFVKMLEVIKHAKALKKVIEEYLSETEGLNLRWHF